MVRTLYKLVIAEEEQDVRRQLAALVEESGCSFEIVSEYKSGIEAYDGIISDKPDIIITDVRIPYINGIELSKMAREIYPSIKIIIITDNNGYEYAKEAANIGVVGLVSKSAALGGIRGLLKKTEDALNEESLIKTKLNQLSAFYRDSLPIIRESELCRLSEMQDITPAFEQRLRGSNISLDYLCFVVCVFDLDESADGKTERVELAHSSIRKSVRELFENICDCEIFRKFEKLCLILKFQVLPDAKKLESLAAIIIQRVNRYTGMSISAGFSGVLHYGKNFSEMVKEAERALEYRSMTNGRKVFFYGDSSFVSSTYIIDDNLIKELGYILHTQTTEECLQRIDIIRYHLGQSRNSLYYAATGIINALIRGCEDREELYARYGGADMIFRELFEIKTEDEIFNYLKDIVRFVRELNDNVIVDNAERNLFLVTSYLEAHYCDPGISFASLAREVNFSVSYISVLLKNKLNTSFVKMLTAMRMEKARELLANPALKILDIAERLGYSDSYYFSHCFKKHMGIAPKEYRINEQKNST